MANGEVMVPLPEMDKSEEPMVANLLIQGVNQMAQRLTSRLPDIEFPSTNPGNTAADRRADNARLAVLGWWDMNQLQRRLAKRARYLVAYGNAPAYIRPVSPNPLDQRSMPYWSFLNPLSVYPAYAGEDEIEALNAVIHRQVSLAWLKARYPRQATFLYKGSSPAPDKMFDLLEWNDGEETVMVVRGAMREERAYIEPSQGTAPYMELERAPNRAGVCLITCPGMISLDKPSGLFDHIIGMFYAQSKLAAYEHIAIRQSIFPEKWVVTHPGSPGTARIVVPADGRMGVIGEVENGTITALNAQPSPLVSQAIDRLERNARVQSSIPSDWGAECLDQETEILTQDGWRTYDKISVGDTVLTLNHESGQSEWQTVETLHVSPVMDHKVIRANQQRFSAVATMNHRWPVLTWNNRRTFVTTEALNSGHRIPICAPSADLPIRAKESDALVEAVAWFYTEGSYRQSGRNSSQSIKHPEYCDNIRSVLTALWGPGTDVEWKTLSGCGQGGVGHDGVPRWNESTPNDRGVIKWNLSAHAVRELLIRAPRKVPSHSFLRSLTLEQLQLFLAVSMWGDGCKGKKSLFGQVDNARTEAFAFAAILAGQPVSYGTRHEKRPQGPTSTTLWNIGFVCVLIRPVIRLRPPKGANGATWDAEVYNGIVWCPTVGNGTWFARRNGKTYFTGNSATNIRTARRGEQVASSASDPTLGELQEIFAEALEKENSRGIRLMKALYPNRMFSFQWGTDDKRTSEDYRPNDVFDSDFHYVKYSMPGVDAASIPIELGQRLQTGTISMETARQADPLVEDPQFEAAQTDIEGLRHALLTSLEARAQNGTLDPHQLALIAQIRAKESKPLEDCVADAQRQVQAEQASTQSAEPGAPETQPGLGTQPQPGGPGPGAAGPPPLSAVLQQLRGPTNQSPSEKALTPTG